LALVVATIFLVSPASRSSAEATDRAGRMGWRMPPLEQLKPPRTTAPVRLLLVAGGLVLVRLVQLATAG
jgi:hypothetical protein